MTNEYRSKQYSLFWLLPYIAALPCFGVGFMLARAGDMRGAGFLLALGGSLAFVAISFQYMVVRDEGDRLSVRFGPLPVFGMRVSYADILVHCHVMILG